MVWDCFQYSITDRELLCLSPAARRHDLVVRCDGKSDAGPASHRTHDAEVQEVFRWTVVEPVDHSARNDGAGFKVVRQDFDLLLLMHDRGDAPLCAIRERHLRVPGKTAKHHAYFFTQLVDE